MKYARALVLVWAWVVVAGCSSGPEAGPILITGAGDSAASNVIRVTGLSGAELRAVAGASLDDAAIQALLRVTTSEAGVPIAGRIVATETALEFQPRSPFNLNRRYLVRFDPGRLPTPRSAPPVATVLRFSTPASGESTSVTAVYPSGETWPENVRRFHVEFSGAMSHDANLRHVHLQDADGREMAGVRLEADAAQWNEDGTRVTVVLNPERPAGRPAGSGAGQRPIVRGSRYRIAIDRDWLDAAGRPLAAAFTREFAAGPPATAPIDLRSWRITVPKAGSRTPVAVVFPASLDYKLLLEAIGVRTADGHTLTGSAATGAAETAWTFTPESPWSGGRYQLAVSTNLEDPAGNGIRRGFGTLPDKSPSSPSPRIETLTFDVR